MKPSPSSFADGYFLIVDKPPNVISHELTSAVGRLFGLKAGHAGTLDPNVSGVLPIGLGRARKLLGFLTMGKKEYVVLAELPWAERLKEEEVAQKLKSFEGVHVQTPPKMAAVKRRPRKRQVHRIEFLERKGKLVLFKTLVDRGTYIRVLAKHMGGRMVELRRTAVEGIREGDAELIQRVQDAVALFPLLLPCLRHPFWVLKRTGLGEVIVKESALERLLHGSPLFPPGVEAVREGSKPYYILRSEELFIGVARRERREGKEVFQPVRIQPLRLTAPL